MIVLLLFWAVTEIPFLAKNCRNFFFFQRKNCRKPPFQWKFPTENFHCDIKYCGAQGKYGVFCRSGALTSVLHPGQYTCAMEYCINWLKPPHTFFVKQTLEEPVSVYVSSPGRNNGVLGHLRYHHSSPIQIYSRFWTFYCTYYFSIFMQTVVQTYLFDYTHYTFILSRLNYSRVLQRASDQGVDLPSAEKPTLVTV